MKTPQCVPWVLMSDTLVKIKFEECDGQHICRIECEKAKSLVYCKYKNKEEEVFGRYGANTKKLPPSELGRWEREKF